MGIFKKKQNKKFNYQSRYYNKAAEGSPFEIKGKFDDDRKASNPARGIKGKFVTAWNTGEVLSDKKVNKRLFIIIVILLLIVLYIIDFDLSIFFSKSK